MRRTGLFSHVFIVLFSSLRFVFGPCALQALDLVDQRSVTCVSSPSGRSVFQVRCWLTHGSSRLCFRPRPFLHTPVFRGHIFGHEQCSVEALWRAFSAPGTSRGSRGSRTLRIHQRSGSHGSNVKACFVAREAADVRAPLSSGLTPPVSPVCQ